MSAVATLIRLAALSAALAHAPSHGAAHALRQAEALTPDSLGAMLKGLGYGVTGTQPYEIEEKRTRFTYHVNLALSKDGGLVWASEPLRTMSDADMADAKLLSNLLKASYEVVPGSFYLTNYAADGKPADWRLELGRSIANVGVTAASLKTLIGKFVDAAESHADAWAPAAK